MTLANIRDRALSPALYADVVPEGVLKRHPQVGPGLKRGLVFLKQSLIHQHPHTLALMNATPPQE